MVNQDTIETINYIKDLEFEYNIKLLILTLFLLYSITFLILTRDTKLDKISKGIMLAWGRISAIIFIINIPFMYTFFLMRGSLETLQMFVVTYYSFTYLVIFLFGQAFFVETIYKMWAWATGMEIKIPKFKRFFDK